MKGRIISDAHGEPIAAKITVTDNKTGKVVGEYRSNKSSGRYTVIIPPGKNYGIFVEAENCIPKSLNVDLPDKGTYYEKVQDIKLEGINAEKPVVTVLNNVFLISIFYYSKLRLEILAFNISSSPEILSKSMIPKFSISLLLTL